MKKTFAKFLKGLVCGGIILSTLCSFVSCGEDSGLGSSVDTEAPSIEVTYPPLGVSVRDSFYLAGTCHDDIGIGYIMVTVTDTTSKEVVDNVLATVDVTGFFWSASLNPYDLIGQKYKYADGNYQFTATAYDGAGHATNASRTFDIDNTAPVFVISNPGVIKSQGKKASAYGSQFTIDGTIADEHTIKSLTAKIFDVSGNLLGEFTEEDIATAGGTSVTIASHYIDRGDGVARNTYNERYTTLYGDDDKAGTKNYYCTILVSDNTKQYKNPFEITNISEGNVTSKLYLYDSVYKELMSSKSGNRFGLSAADFMTILNGTRKDDGKNAKALEVLKASVIDTSDESGEDKDAKKLSFSLNPQANPTYNVNGFAAKRGEDGNYEYIEASSGNTVSVTISAGLDGTAILPGKVKIWSVLIDGLTDAQIFERLDAVAKRANEVQKQFADVAEIHENAAEIESYVTSAFGNGVVTLIKDNSDDTGSSVTMGNVAGMLPLDTYVSGKIYAFVVTGCDEDDVVFNQNTLYAFKASEAGLAPTLEILEPANLAYIKSTSSSDLVFKGKTYMPEASSLKVSSLTILMKVQDENNANAPVGDAEGYTITVTRDENSGAYNSTDPSLTYNPDTTEWTFTPSAHTSYPAFRSEEGGGKSLLFLLDITTESTSGHNIVKSHSIHVDTTKPIVTISNVTPYVDGTQFYSDLDSEKGENAKTYVNGDISVKFNVEETNLREVFYKVLVDGEEKVGQTSLGRLFSGTIDLDTTKWTSSATEKKNLEVIVSAVDSCGNNGSSNTTSYNTISGVAVNNPIVICQETDIPQIKVSNASVANFKVTGDATTNKTIKERIEYGKNLFNIDNNNTLQINLNDDDSLASAKVTIYNESGEQVGEPAAKTLNNSSFSWNFALPKVEGIYQVEVDVTDTKLGSATSGTVQLWRKNNTGKFFIAIDNGAPTATIIAPTENSYQETTFAANGKISEKDEYTKLTRYLRKRTSIDNDGKDVYEDRGSGVNISINDDRTWSESLENLEEGIYRLEYEAKDRYNQTATAAVKITVDKTAPVFDDSRSSVGGVNGVAAVSASSKWFNNVALSFQGKFEEATGIELIYYWLDRPVTLVSGSTKADLSTATKSFAAKNDGNSIWSYSETILGFDECTAANPHKITLVAVDKAGNQSNPVVYDNIKVDMTQPKFENFYYTMGSVTNMEVNGSILTNGNNNVTLYGIINDTKSGVDVSKLVLNVGDAVLADSSNITFTTATINNASELAGSTFQNASEIADTTRITGWKAEIASNNFVAGEVRATYYDNAQNYNKDVKMFNIRVDSELPKLNNYSLEDETPGYNVYKKEAHKYFVNNGDGHTFKLSGIATDNEGVKKVELIDGSGNAIKTADKGDFEWTSISLATLAADSTVTVRITDIANNIFEQKILIIPDTSAPNGVHDSGNVDRYFRLGNETGVSYSAETYGNNSTLKVRGYFDDASGSGLKMVYYKLFSNPSVPTSAQIADFVTNYESASYCSPINEETNTIDGEAIKTNFKTDVSGFEEGKNYLVLLAVDNVGNVALDTKTCTPDGTTQALNGCYEIRIDKTLPNFEKFYYELGSLREEVKGNILTNGKKDVTLYGVISDGDSGIDVDNFKFYISDGTVIADTTTLNNIEFTTATNITTAANLANCTFGPAPADKKSITGWKLEIKDNGTHTNSTYNNFNKNGDVYADYFDKAGNGNKKVKMFSVRVDNELPKLSNPSLKDEKAGFTAYNSKAKATTEVTDGVTKEIPYYFINNSSGHAFTVSGIATDNEGIAKIELKNGTTVLDTKNTGIFEFENQNFSSLSGETTLTISITDTADNVSDYKIIVNPDTTPPEGVHDVGAEDKYFRIGNAQGLKYSETTYGNNSTLKVRGYFDDTDSGSGLKMVYYKLFHNVADIDIDAFKAGYENESYCSPIAIETNTIDSTEVKTNFKTDVSGFKEGGDNYLVILAVDNVGNVAVDTKNYGDTTGIRNYYKINVDLTAPTFDNFYYELGSIKGAVNDRILTNGTSDVVLYGAISDALSGVDAAKLRLYINGTDIANSTTLNNITFTKDTVSTAADLADSTKCTFAAASTFNPKEITGWKAEISATNFVTGELRADYYDISGISNINAKMFSVMVDNVPPKLSNPALKDETAGFTAYKSKDKTTTEGSGATAKEVPYYFINNSDGHQFTVSGIATDNEGVAKIELKNGTTVLGTATEGNFTFEHLSLAADVETTLTLKITDAANNVSDYKIVFMPDTTGPEGKHGTGTTDSYFRLGNAKRGAETDVGLDYSEKTYVNNSTVKVRGFFDDAAGSGLKMVYYKLFNHVPTETEITAFNSGYETDTENTKAEAPVPEEEKVSGVKTNFKTDIPNFKEGENYLVILAVDNVGNARLDTKVYNYTESGVAKTVEGCYKINIDLTAPTFERFYYKLGTIKGEVSGSILTNGENDVTLYGLISDAASGVDADKLKLYLLSGTSKVYIAETDATQTNHIQFTTEATSWTDSTVSSVQYSTDTTVGLEKWVEKADSTFKDASLITDTTKITGWKVVIDKTKFNSGEVRAEYSDIAGNNSNGTKMFSVRVDTEKPKLSNHTLTDTKDGYIAYKSKEETEGTGADAKQVPYYFINNKNDATEQHLFVLNGVATDNEGIAKVELLNGTAPLASAEKAEFNFSALDLSSLSGETPLTLKITDVANNVSDYKIVLIPDVTPPNGIHHTDTKGKDKEFRIGEQVYGTEKVGAKYSAGTYGNANAIMIRGLFDEIGSGLSMIYYKLSQTIPTDDDINGENGFVKKYKDKATGYFTPTTKTAQTISVNTDSGTDEESIDYNFKTLLSGFQEGKNYLVLVAVDNVGNAKVDTKTFSYKANSTDTSDTTVNCYSINVDTAVPNLSDNVAVEIDGSSEGLSASQILTNFEKGDITLSGKADDEAAGIKSVELYVEGKGTDTAGGIVTIDKTTTVTVTGVVYKSLVSATLSDGETGDPAGTKKWSGKVAAQLFSNVKSGTFAVYATVKDNAGEGNMVNRSVATIIVDKEAPTVVLKSPVDADSTTPAVEINGIIDLSGEVKDGNILPDTAITALQYTTTAPASATDSDWTDATDSLMTGFALSGNYTFSAKNFDTSKLTEDTVYYLRAKAVDKAGNVGYSPSVEVKVDQDTDRPIIKISSMDGADAIISSDSIMGTVSDDDGIEDNKIYYKDGTADTWHEIDVNSGSWRIDGLTASGHNLMFKVVDTAGTTFETANPDSVEPRFADSAYPYIIFGTSTKALGENQIGFAVDLNDPKIWQMRFASTGGATGSFPTEEVTEDTVWKSSGGVSYGPASNWMSIYLEVRDDVSMHKVRSGTPVVTEADATKKDISIRVGTWDTETNAVAITRSVSSTTESDANGTTWTTYIYKIGPVNTTAAHFASGNNTVTITATDESGRKSSDTFNIFIDDEAPTVNSFYKDSANGITGKVTIPGSVTDSKGIKTVKWMIPTKLQRESCDEDESNIYGATSWNEIPIATTLYAELNLEFTSSSFIESTESAPSLIYYAVQKDDTSKLKYACTRTGAGTEASPYTYAQATADETTGKFPSELYIPIFFYAEDTSGNKGIKKFYYKVNPDGGIPKVYLTSHAETKDSATDAVKLVKTGNTINLMGSADDDESVISAVKITELEYTTNPDMSATMPEMSATMPETSNWTKVTLSSIPEAALLKGSIDTTETGGAILCEGTTSWKVSINTTEIAHDEDGNGLITGVRITLVAYDDNGTRSNQTRLCALPENYRMPCTHRIIVDKTVPTLKSASIVGFRTDATVTSDTPVFEKTYQSGMYFSGSKADLWFLKATIEDDSSVTGFNISCQKGRDYIEAIEKINVDNDSPKIGITDLSKVGGNTNIGEKTFTVWIPITTTAEGHVYATLEMLDGQHTDVTTAFSFFIDNTAPALYETSSGTAGVANDALAHASTLRLKSNGLQVDAENNVVENSDGSYTFGDELVEARSGLAYVVFYFKKAANATFSTTNRVYSPMFGKGDTAEPNKVVLADAKTTDEVYINSENLPALVKTVTRDANDLKKISFTGLGANKFINNAAWNTGATTFGLVKIGGAYHKITAIDSNTATLDEDVPANYTEAEFIYAMLVDHQIAEGFSSSASDTTGVSNDDGDGLVEMVKQTGSTYKWTASILSDNIPDGPAEIHIVAFDEAGNVNSGYVETSIQNNRPRIARVYLATDLNGNAETAGDYKFDFYNEEASGPVINPNSERFTENGTEYGELVYYSTLSKESKVQGVATLKPSQCRFVVSNGLLVLPEIIGGNGTLKYAYYVSDDAYSETDDSITAAASVGITKTTTLKDLYAPTAPQLKIAKRTGSKQTVADFFGEKTVIDTNQTLVTSGTGTTGNYQGFVLDNTALSAHESWTSTDGKKYKYFAFTFWDETSETTQGQDSLYALLKLPLVINVEDDVAPEATIKPFYWNSKEDGSFVYDEDGAPQGHIDLETETRPKPGVSGEIYIDGTAYDETRLSKIELKEPNGSNILVATYSGGTWTPAAGATVKTITEPSQKGHRVSWRYKKNMTSYGLAEDQTFDAIAYDASEVTTGGNTNTADTTQTTNTALTSHYKMDFVPYIKSIYPATESSASRSRLGKFPVQAGKDMVIEGMNFSASSSYSYTVKFYKSKPKASLDPTKNGADVQATTASEIIANAAVTKVADGKIQVTAPDYSRYVEVEVTSTTGVTLSTLNNTNKNLGCNIEEGYVASDDNGNGNADRGLKRANDAGTNFWTDDRYIAVWNVPDATLFAGSINPHSGVIKKVSEQNSGSGWISENNPVAAAPGGGYLYKQPGQNTQVDPITGMNNSYYAAISSDDLKLYGYVSGQDYSTLNHGDNIAFNSSEVAYFAPVDEMDYTIVNGMPYYVYQDNSLGGDSGSVWGLGLSIAREGTFYSRTYFNTGKGNTIEEEKLPFIVERQGYNLASHKRNSSTGYDSVLYQFKNPRIAGWFDASDELLHNSGTGAKVKGVDLIYVSYYDSYAKCLKYAAYRIGHRITTKEGDYAHVGLQEWGKFDVDHDLDIVAEMTSSPNLRKWDDTADVATSSNQPEQKSFNHMTDGATVVAGNDTTSNNPTFSEVAGEWSDVFVDATTPSDPRPVIIYYNKKAKSLEIAYGNKKFPEGKTDWTKSLGIKPTGITSDFGRYVSAAMDKAGNLHVAAQDADKAKLYYLYLTKSGSSYSVAKSVAVDASNGAGRWTDIELTDPSATGTGKTLADIAPVISYIDTSFLGTTKGVKAAYVADIAADGTPIFEAMTDPARYSPSDQRTSVMADVKETKAGSVKAPVAVGFNSDMLALDFLRGEE